MFVARCVLAFCLIIYFPVQSQIPDLPTGSLVSWSVDNPKELVQYLAFDTVAFADYLPDSLRFLTIGEMAGMGHGESTKILASDPDAGPKGVLFFEIIENSSVVNGKSSDSGNIVTALMVAGVIPRNPASDFESGRLMLQAWSSDPEFSRYVNATGIPRLSGDVTFKESADGSIQASLHLENASVMMGCSVSGEAIDMNPSLNKVYLPKTFSSTTYLMIAYAGHKMKACSNPVWKVDGEFELKNAMPLGPTQFQYNYDMRAGVYNFPTDNTR